MAADDIDGLAALQKSRHHAGLHRRDGRDAGADRRGHRARGLPDRQPQDPARRRAGPGPGDPRPLPSAGVACWVGSMPELGHRPGRRHPPGDAGQLQVPHRRRAVRPLVRRRLRRSAAGARLAGAVQRPHPARPRLPGRPGQAPALPGSPGRIHGQDDRVGSAIADHPSQASATIEGSLDDNVPQPPRLPLHRDRRLADRRRPERIGRSRRLPADRRHPRPPLGPDEVPARLAGAGQPPAPQLPLGGLPDGDPGAGTRQGNLHGSGR